MAKKHSSNSSSADNVKVIVRVRPIGGHEEGEAIVQMDPNMNQVHIRNPDPDKKFGTKTFTYDGVYDADSTQIDVFAGSIQPIVDDVIKGYNGTIFAYGQTGSGKTFTMSGENSPPDKRGIIPNAMQYFFDTVGDAPKDHQFLIQASFLEIYNEEIRDLLEPKKGEKLKLRYDKNIEAFFVEGLSAHTVKCEADVDQIVKRGNKARVTAATAMNKQSSRSHSIFTLRMECREVIDGKETFKVGKLNLVDLAGSERQKKTGAEGARFQEGVKINMSLTTLGRCITALVARADNPKEHVPYSDSKLTKLLQDSLGGNSKTVMIANIGPAGYNYDETLSTLRFADRAKQIKNKPRINEDPKDAMLRQMRDQIEQLKAMLGQQVGVVAGVVASPPVNGVPAADTEAAKEAQRQLDAMKSKLEEKEAQLVKGGIVEESLKTRAHEHKALLQKAKLKLREKSKEKVQLQQKFHDDLGKIKNHYKRREQTFKATYNSLQEELDEKTAAVESLESELEQTHGVLADRERALMEKDAALEEAYEIAAQLRQENAELLEQQSQFLRELNLEALISDCLLPADMKDAVLSLAQWDEVEQIWYLTSQDKAGNILRPQVRQIDSASKRPVSAFTHQRKQQYPTNTRYTTEDALGPTGPDVVPASAVQNTEAQYNQGHTNQRSAAPTRPMSGLRMKRSGSGDIPLARGLVSEGRR
ncbi:Kinesin motor domain [Carpediemonas membranifera]|uniref:Kinesin-like protein n=1 Tax=Carpediemonas membranifera TaxID=201153 RepID=A0A8J6ATN7_9EUKA|nr:Kinesin motor domain [Carpediemonas membranifera]|eukprot:KAG9391215.1 Kinesin motor domain [Carpediemonas membranifera]